MVTQNRCRPPYAREIQTLLNSGQPFPDGQRCIWICCGREVWEQAEITRKRHAVLVLPYGEHASSYRWPVSGLDSVVLVAGHIGSSDLEALGTELVCAGSPLVAICDEARTLGGAIVTFKPRKKAA